MDEAVGRALRAAGASVEIDGTRVQVTPTGRESARRVVELLVERRVPWAPVGSGRRPIAPAAVVVSTRALCGLLDLWSEDLVCRVGAGTPLVWLEDRLRPQGLRLSASAPGSAHATVGGAFASADRGLVGTAAGGLRDRVLGATFVDGQGNLVKAGARVVKNVAGYDLARLHHGARGAFGLVLDLVVRLDARPPATRAARWPCPLAALRSRLASVRRPSTDRDPHVQAWVNGAAAQAHALGDEAQLVAAVEGWSETVELWWHQSAAQASVDLARVRDLLWTDPMRWVLRWSAPPSVWMERWPDVESELRQGGADPWAIGDCLAGEMQIALKPSSHAAAVVQRLIGPTWPVHLDRSEAPVDVAVERSPIARRLKRAFDPHGLLPDLPAPWRAAS
jgi:FAD/FMN-containing dehydrogenase